jgi:hypothetical protein
VLAGVVQTNHACSFIRQDVDGDSSDPGAASAGELGRTLTIVLSGVTGMISLALAVFVLALCGDVQGRGVVLLSVFQRRLSRIRCCC